MSRRTHTGVRTLVLGLAALAGCRSAEPAAGSTAAAAPQPLTLDRAFEASRAFRAPAGLFGGWMADGKRYLALDEVEGERRWVAVDVGSGARAPLYDVKALERALAAVAGVSAEQAAAWSRSTSHELAPSKDALLVEQQNDLFHWPFGAERAVRLTHDAAEEQGATFSPDGRRIAFVRDHDVFVVGVDGAAEKQLTTDGEADFLVGRLDWVYQEEVYGRGNFNGMWWSPDSTRLALLALDQKPVPKISITDHRGTHWTAEELRYPKAGDPNPIASLSVVDVESGARTPIDLSAYPDDDRLIVRVGWTPSASDVVVQVQNRIQTWLDLLAADPATGKTRRILRDQTAAWIEPVDGLEWIDDGARFLWLSERDGFRHLYLYSASGELERQVTSGAWEVDDLLGFDAASGWIYVNADRGDVKGDVPHRVRIDGSGLDALMPIGGTHAVSMSPTFAHFIDTWSSIATPGSIRLCSSDGAVLRTLWQADEAALREFGYVAPRFVQPKTRDGFELEAMWLAPAGFDPKRKYPVVCHVYSGPHAPQVRDAFQGFNGWFHQMLAQQGYLVWICDNRSASGKGMASQVGVHRNLGVQELADIEDGLDWLIAQGFADPSRIGIWGWSYGGYMAAFALTHSTRFKVGIAGAPVTDWRLYDSIYTERLMDLPSLNAKGYGASSV